MEIRESKKHCIITPLSPKLNERETQRLMGEISCSDKIIGIDMSCVKDCTIDFINRLRGLDLCLFNIQSDIFALLLNMNMDKTWKLFVSEPDFLENKHQLLNRKFTVL